MTFETYQLPSLLRKHIASIFHFKDFVPDHSIERVVPTGHSFLIFELDGFLRHTYHNDSLKPDQSFSKVWISGMHRNYISISAHKHSEMFVIQFEPAGAYPFLHLPICRLNERVVAAEEILGQEILDLREALLEAPSSEAKFKLAENWLNQRFDLSKEAPAELLGIIEKLNLSPVANFNEIIASYPNTQKHLIEQFKKYVGLTPKYYHRILRFNEILQKINQKKICVLDSDRL